MGTHSQPPVGEEFIRLHGTEPITVLHVDNDPDFADLVGIYLERENSAIDVRTETTAQAGLEQLAGTAVDCIVSDYDMPGTDGLEFLATVREAYPTLPFIMFTGNGDETIASEAISAGATDYIRKGIGTDQYTVLENRITNAVAQHRAEQEISRGFQAIETAREGIGLLDESGTFLYVNQAYAETYGYDREDLLGEHWELLYPDAHLEQIYEEILPSVPEDGRWEGESVHVTAEGTRLLVDHALAYTDDETMVCLIRDITDEQTPAEAERRHFEQFVDAIATDAIVTLDPEGYVTSWNEGAKRLHGYTPAAIVGDHVSTLFPEEGALADPADLLGRALADDWVTAAGTLRRQDGDPFRAELAISAVFDEDDHHCGFTLTVQDVSDQYAAEINGDSQFIEQAVDVLEDVFYVIDSEGNIARITDRAAEVTGYSTAELRSMQAVELFPAEYREEVRAEVETALATGSAEIEAPLETKDGRTIPYEFRKRRLTDDDGTVVGTVGIGRDISERKRQERQLRRQLEQFEQFAEVLSHDLRTPLQTAAGRIELAADAGDLEHLEKAQRALDRLDTLIEDLATVLREGKLVSDLTEIDLATVLGVIWETLPTDEAKLRVSETARFRGDESAVRRLLENLLKNALDHGAETVTVGIQSDGFYVADDGPGVPADLRDDIFELGYSTKPSDEGTGFGLASARQIAVAHGWGIQVTDGPDGGTRFEMTDVSFVEQ